eukprot:1558809-Pyramimonas_sp.AAC.1
MPSNASEAAVVDFEQKMARRARGEWAPNPFRVRQGKLGDAIWNGSIGKARNGAHFPLVAFTHNA